MNSRVSHLIIKQLWLDIYRHIQAKPNPVFENLGKYWINISYKSNPRAKGVISMHNLSFKFILEDIIGLYLEGLHDLGITGIMSDSGTDPSGDTKYLLEQIELYFDGKGIISSIKLTHGPSY